MKAYNEKTFLSEILMRNVSILSFVFGLLSLLVAAWFHELTLLSIFERLVKLLLTVLTFWSFTRIRWDVTKGMMGGLLFSLLYQESFLVLGSLWGGTSDFDSYLIMGVQGSFFLAAQSMSFMMTAIIIVNHFIICFSHTGSLENLIFNQLSILFKIMLYVFLMIINIFLKLPAYKQVIAGFEYIADLGIIFMLICIEVQLDNFNAIKHDLLMQKKNKEAHYE